jgi:hypothetical protein
MHLERKERINYIVKNNINSLKVSLDKIQELNLDQINKGLNIRRNTNILIEEGEN